ncbi:hypothetical protein, partial [Hydrogenimonas sp.]
MRKALLLWALATASLLADHFKEIPGLYDYFQARTYLKNPHMREWHAIGAITRRKAQGVAEATF